MFFKSAAMWTKTPRLSWEKKHRTNYLNFNLDFVTEKLGKFTDKKVETGGSFNSNLQILHALDLPPGKSKNNVRNKRVSNKNLLFFIYSFFYIQSFLRFKYIAVSREKQRLQSC